MDSRPLQLSVVLSDDSDTFTEDFEVAVPWPMLVATRIEIDDDEPADEDGLFDPDETSTLEIELANRGALSTDGTVDCVLSVEEGSTATATVLYAEGGYGTLDIGEYRDEDDFEVQVDSGVDGEELGL